MAKHSSQSPSLEFRSMDAFVRHYYPNSESKPEGEQDISAVAEHLAALTVQSVRRQLAKQRP